jgi:predicted nucleic acid-binding protein
LTCLKRLDAIRTLPLDPVAADRAARVFRALEDSGRRIEPGACLIAGITLHHGGSLLTRYTKHVERVEGLTLA